jgi:hypothetical protein
MKNNSKFNRGFIVPLIVGIVAVLIILGVYVYENNKAEPVVIPSVTTYEQTISTTSNVVNGLTTYISPTYGFSFQYDPRGMKIYEDGNTVYIDSLGDNDLKDGDYITAFNKNPSDTLGNAIKNVVLGGNLPAGCTEASGEHSNFLSDIGSNLVTVSLFDSGLQQGQQPNTCVHYVDQGSPQFFFENTLRPNVFYFISLGNAFGGSQNTISWDNTLNFSTSTVGSGTN